MTQDVQPLTWQKRTNLEEHQQFFSKINEIIDNLAPTVDEAEAAIAQAVQALADANDAIATANAASAAASAAASQAQTAASTVAGYDARLTAAEGDIDAAEGDIAALQGRMGTAEGNITALQNVQPDYVKKAGAAQTVTSQIMVPTTATGLRDTQIANGTRIQNDLDAYELMVRTENNQNITGIKNNLTEGRMYLTVGGTTERWVRLAYTNIADAAGEFTVFPDKQTGLSDCMKAWFQIRQNLCNFRYMNTVGTLDPSRYAFTFDGTNFEIWYHYITNDTNHRITIVFDGMNAGRVMTLDGVTTKAAMDPSEYTIYQNPVIL